MRVRKELRKRRPTTVSTVAPINLAREEAMKLYAEYPAIFNRTPVLVRDIAKALGVRILRRRHLRQRGQLEIPSDRMRAPTIVIREDVPDFEARFVIAHEIGHAVLLKKHPDAVELWPLRDRERFANWLAIDMLAPPDLRTRYEDVFRSALSAVEAVHLASNVGLTPHAFLTLASYNLEWLNGLDKIWLRVKYTLNQVTGHEPRYRIASAHYDSARFFIPTNRTIRSFAGDDSLITPLHPGESVAYEAQVKLSLRKGPTATPRFSVEMRAAKISAVRLKASADQAPYVIMLVDARDAKT